MSLKNQIMLITYADSLGKNLEELDVFMFTHLQGVIGGVHVLPFYPSSADRGFAPLTYEQVDPAFGSWDDIAEIAQNHDLMTDFMINHISRSSEYYKDFAVRKAASPYKDLFIRYKHFWPEGEPSEADMALVYKRKPRDPFIDIEFSDGTNEKLWCTFDSEQVDLDVTTETTRQFIRSSLESLARHGSKIIRLDAFAYATKKPGTSCFFVEPDVWDILDFAKEVLAPLGVEILPEIHEHYGIQLKMAEKGYWVYDFALPMLLLHTLFSGDNTRLKHWLTICPRKQYTTLDTHDGIGVVDVRDLLSDLEIDAAQEALYTRGANIKKIYNSTAYNNLDIYQLNCSYYSALGNDDEAYLLARAIQFFTPGIPQVYYMGLLAGENDIALLEETKVGRNINRHYYTLDDAVSQLDRPVVQKLFSLMRFRNVCKAFDGELQIMDSGDPSRLTLQWNNGSSVALLDADLKDYSFRILAGENGPDSLAEIQLS